MPIITQIFAGEMIPDTQNPTAQFFGADFLYMKAPGPDGQRPDWSEDGSFVEVDCALLVEVEPGFSRQVPLDRGYISSREPLRIPREISAAGLPMELRLLASTSEVVEVFAVAIEQGGNGTTPWRFTQNAPSTDLLWFEVDASGLPVYEWPWRWNSQIERWVSDRSYLLTTSDAASNFKSGSFASLVNLNASELFIERIDFRFYLDTNQADVDWFLELNQVQNDLSESSWSAVNLAGSPLREWRLASLPLAAVISLSPGGFSWKISPVKKRGSVNFEVQVITRNVRADV